jgi:SAM-dependent methyltransferase
VPKRPHWRALWKLVRIYFSARGCSAAAVRHFSLPMLSRVLRRGDLDWPAKTAEWIAGRDVLDLGCGRNYQGYAFFALGARSYTGLDPTLELDGDMVKDNRGTWGRHERGGITPRELMRRFPRIRYATARIEDFAPAEPFDVIVMHNVTEHLHGIAEVFARFPALLRPRGRLVFSHPNFYAWHGHHMKPRTPAEIIPGDPQQAAVMDWAHVRFDPVAHEWIGRTQNRIRLDDLRAVVEREFEVELWRERETRPEEGLSRLTPEILARYPEFTRRDLAVNFAFVVAKLRGVR